MQPIGTVIAKQPGQASVHLVRHSACQDCHACVLGAADSASITIIAADSFDVRVGQQVQLFIPPSQGLRAALLVYTTPLIVLFAGYALLAALALPGGALTPALGSLLLSFASFFLLRLGEQKRKEDPRFLPHIVGIVES